VSEHSNIAKAFIKAKKAFAPAMKTSTNPHFRSKYADLAACVEAVDDAFLANGIVMYQETSEDAEGVTVETVLLHESGEMIRCGKLHMPATKSDAQGFMSALTYCRRGSLMAACGIAPEDDDGNAAVKSSGKRPTPKSVWDAEAVTKDIVSAKTRDELTAAYAKWNAVVAKGSEEAKFLVDLAKARAEDIGGEA
jgi:hypothetical protein